jgi:hypothetical protein
VSAVIRYRDDKGNPREWKQPPPPPDPLVRIQTTKAMCFEGVAREAGYVTEVPTSLAVDLEARHAAVRL